jgi:hypothetical protein
MKITLESTDDIALLNGVQCRVWVGETQGGKRIMAYVHRIAVRDADNVRTHFVDDGGLRGVGRPSGVAARALLEKHLGKPAPED